MRKYFGTDGVRGKANIFPMTSDFALRLGQAVGRKFLEQSTPPYQVVIGKDTRLSCYMFEAALVAGLCSQGVNAVLVGSIPTPAIAFITKSLRANAGIVISASHNPYYDNGIKIFDPNGEKLSDTIELEIEEMIDNGIEPSSDIIGRALRIETAVGRYVEYAKSTFDKELNLRGLKIVVDCANGASYKVAPLALAELGAELTVINDKPNGVNINSNCGATCPDTISNAVKEHKADIGIAFDGDGDRVLVSDKSGRIYDGDHIMGICALDMKNSGILAKDTLVATVMSNLGFVNSMSGVGVNVERSPVGDRYVTECMRANGYNLGGEQSGHIIFSSYSSTGDGLVSALQLLKVMIRTGRTLDELGSFIKVYPQHLLNLDVSKKIPLDKLSGTQKIIKEVENELHGNGRILIRYSGTERKLRVMVEGEDAATIERYAKSIASAAEKEISEYI